jgi:non-specific serine/threonine protein kinase
MVSGDFGSALDPLQAGLALARATADPRLVAQAFGVLSNVSWLAGNYVPARQFAVEGLAAGRLAGDPRSEAYNLYALAAAMLEFGEDAAAGDIAQRGLKVSREAGYPAGAAMATTVLGQVQLRRGDLAGARALLERGLNEFRIANMPLAPLFHMVVLGWVCLAQGDLSGARGMFFHALMTGLNVLGGRGHVRQPLEGFAQLAVAEGKYERALQLAGAASALRERYHMPRPPTSHLQIERWLEQARAALGEERSAAAFAAGKSLDPEQVVAEILAGEPAKGGRSASSDGAELLTPREREVAALVAEGLTTRQIAERLVITQGTARVHIERILAKLHLHSRAQLSAWEVQRRLVRTPLC